MEPPEIPADGSPADLSHHELPPGLVLGSYTIVGLMARGGMAEIYLALTSDERARPVVIKRVLPHLPEKDDPHAMFADEAALSARLHHANVAEVLDVVEVEGSLFIVLEHLHGADALEILKTCDRLRRRVPYEVAVQILLGIAAGLHYAHELRGPEGEALHVIHRDVSPQNLFVTFEGNVKLLDFGLAKSIFRAATTRDGAAKGKLSYMSPEQVMTRPLDRRTDVFSLGICMWELTVGLKLYDTNRGELTIVQEILEKRPPAPSEIYADYPKALEAVVMRALAKRPDERYPTVFAMARALEAAAREAGITPSREALAEFMVELFPERASFDAESASHDLHALELANRREDGKREGTEPEPPPEGDARRAILQTQRVAPLRNVEIPVETPAPVEPEPASRAPVIFFRIAVAISLVMLGAALAVWLR